MKSGRFASFRHQSRPSSTSSSSFSLMAVATEWRFFSSSSSTPTSSSAYQAFTTFSLTELRLFFSFSFFFFLHLHLCSVWSQSVPDLLQKWFGGSSQKPSSFPFESVFTPALLCGCSPQKINGVKARPQTQQKALVLNVRKADIVSCRSSARAGGRPQPAV